MPNAVYSADLEEFRLSLFANKIEDANSLRVENTGCGTQPPDINRCSWCGICMPLPIYQTIIIDTATGIQEARSTSEPDPIVCQLEEVVKAVDELVEVSLCQAPCEVVHEIANVGIVSAGQYGTSLVLIASYLLKRTGPGK